MSIETELAEVKERVTRLENSVSTIDKAVAVIQGSTSSIEMILKWVVLPLLVILGGLVGIKIVLP